MLKGNHDKFQWYIKAGTLETGSVKDMFFPQVLCMDNSTVTGQSL